MSTTYSLVCDDCKLKAWAGQGGTFYDPDGVCGFMHEHQGHRLRLLNDLVDGDDHTHGPAWDYEDVNFKFCREFELWNTY